MEENGGGLDELDYRADEGLIGGKGDVYATRSTDYDIDEEEKRALGEKKIRLNEVGHSHSCVGIADEGVSRVSSPYIVPINSFEPTISMTGESPRAQDGEIDDGLYRGKANYLQTINKRTDVLDKKMQHGPIRATANIRTITLVDYQPDVCKDYKETGFCGFGDSCKFLHDRGDYLAGWQLDKLDNSVAVAQDEEEEEVPFACLICRNEFTEPVVTKCGHYFCMKSVPSLLVGGVRC